jgi:hypothetical protein
MNRVKSLRHVWWMVLPAVAAFGVIFSPSRTPRQSPAAAGSVAGVAPAPLPRAPAALASARPAALVRPPPSAAAEPAQPLELRSDFRNRAERHRYYDARVQYEAELAAALRRVAAELAEVDADEEQDEPGPDTTRAESDVNAQDLSARIAELESQAEQHERRGREYAAAR